MQLLFHGIELSDEFTPFLLRVQSFRFPWQRISSRWSGHRPWRLLCTRPWTAAPGPAAAGRMTGHKTDQCDRTADTPFRRTVVPVGHGRPRSVASSGGRGGKGRGKGGTDEAKGTATGTATGSLRTERQGTASRIPMSAHESNVPYVHLFPSAKGRGRSLDGWPFPSPTQTMR
jgi:hypothetical protein